MTLFLKKEYANQTMRRTISKIRGTCSQANPNIPSGQPSQSSQHLNFSQPQQSSHRPPMRMFNPQISPRIKLTVRVNHFTCYLSFY